MIITLRRNWNRGAPSVINMAGVVHRPQLVTEAPKVRRFLIKICERVGPERRESIQRRWRASERLPFFVKAR